MAADADFTGLKGELLYEYYIRQEGDDVTRTVTAKEAAGWLHEVALQQRSLANASWLEKPAPTPSVLWKTALTPSWHR